jgi:hypothetical protein
MQHGLNDPSCTVSGTGRRRSVSKMNGTITEARLICSTEIVLGSDPRVLIDTTADLSSVSVCQQSGPCSGATFFTIYKK